jgi:hypothetical protein
MPVIFSVTNVKLPYNKMPLSHTLEAVWGQQQRKKENKKDDAQGGGRSEAFTEK